MNPPSSSRPRRRRPVAIQPRRSTQRTSTASRRQVRRWLRRELGWLLIAAGIAGLAALALGTWQIAAPHRLDLVATAVVLVLIGLPLLAGGRPR